MAKRVLWVSEKEPLPFQQKALCSFLGDDVVIVHISRWQGHRGSSMESGPFGPDNCITAGKIVKKFYRQKCDDLVVDAVYLSVVAGLVERRFHPLWPALKIVETYAEMWLPEVELMGDDYGNRFYCYFVGFCRIKNPLLLCEEA